MNSDQDLSSEKRDQKVLKLHDQLLEIEQRLIPTGLHIFGRASHRQEKLDMLKMVASFDRPEAGARALPDLVAEGLGLAGAAKPDILTEEARDAREQIDSIVSVAVKTFLQEGSDAAEIYLTTQANVS